MAKIASRSPSTGPMPRLTLKQLIRSGEVFVGGIVAEYARPSLFKIYGHAGFDFGFIEYEHGCFEPTMLAASILSARDMGLPVVAKVPQLDRAAVAMLLESGVNGIQLPRTESRRDVETLRDYMKFAPLGTRAIAPGYGSSDYAQPHEWRSWMDQQNDETVLVVHIETEAGFQHAEEIVTTPGVDMVYVGPGDFSIAMGHPGGYDHPDVIGPMREILAICRRHGVSFGTTASGIDAAAKWIVDGARFFETIDELTLIADGAARLVRGYREAAAGSRNT
jgi:4-hydroxy-2-oxoheptanedioate aldolase